MTGYHEKSAIRALNAEPTVKKRQTRARPSLYDEAVRAALIVLWEASDRVCGKRLRTRWTEAAPLVVRESGLLVETLERVRLGLPFALRALDVDNGSEFVNESLIDSCLTHRIELTRSRPWRKNDQA